MGRELDCVIANDRIGKGKFYIPTIDNVIDIRSAGTDSFYNVANALQDNLRGKMIDYGSYHELINVIEYDWYNNLDISKEIDSFLKLNFPKYINKFLVEVKEKGNKLGFCFITGRLYSLGKLIETDVDVIEYDYVDDVYDSLCSNPKDFMRAVDKLDLYYGISVWTSIYIAEDFDSYRTNANTKKTLDKRLLIKNRSKKLGALLEHCKELNKYLWESDEYKDYYEYMLLHLKNGYSFIYSV